MPRISVLVPTHEHSSTLPYAVRSVQTQGVDDLEILICGDGVSDELRAVVVELQRADPRIRFFDLPKAPCIGELNRDHVLRQANGQIVCIHNDDDLWLPGHIEVLERALEDADFVGAMQVNVGTDGKVRAHYFDLERPEFVEPWLDWRPNNFGSWACNGFGPIFVAHWLDAYMRLPEGWATTPVGLPTDQVMWHKFLRQPWCRAKFLRWPIALHFPSSERRDWTPEQRAEELRHWTQIIESPDYAVRIWRDVLPDLGDRLLCQSLQEQRLEILAAHEAALAREQTLRAAEHEAFVSRIRELEGALAAERAAQASQIVDMKAGFDAERQAAVGRIRELEAKLAAEHNAFVARIRELEGALAAERAAQASQIVDMKAGFDAERRAAVRRIRELETTLAAEHNAFVSRIRELEGGLAANSRSPVRS